MSDPDPKDRDLPARPEPGLKEPLLDHFFELVLRHEETRTMWFRKPGDPVGDSPTLLDDLTEARARLLRRTKAPRSQPNSDH